MTRGEELLSLLRRRISRRRRITFAEYMATALYEPGLGRYCASAPPMGASGDYITSPEVDEAFGRLLGRAVREMWERLGGPSGGEPFHIIEAGPGRGTLCRDLLAGLAEESPVLHRRLQVTLVEASEPLRREQERLLAPHPASRGRIRWRRWEDLVQGPPVTGCLLANEFLDALPVHLVEWRDGRLHEVFVTLGPDGRLGEELGEPSRPELEGYFTALGISLAEGQRAEVNLQALEWIRQAASLLAGGYAVVVDYGHEAAELFSQRHHAGTLVGYRNHQVMGDPLACPGEQDLTSHVDFTSVVRAALEGGFSGWALTSQRNFLICAGLASMIADLAVPPEGASAAGTVQKRFSLHALMSPGGMGGTFKVLVLGRRAPVEALTFIKDPFREPVEGLDDGVYYSGLTSRTAPREARRPGSPSPGKRGSGVSGED